MNYFYVFVTALAFVSACANAANPQFDTRAVAAIINKYGGSIEAYKPRTISRMSEVERQTMWAYYRKRYERLSQPAEDPFQAFEAPEIITQLLRFGDLEIISQTAKTFLDSDAGSRQYYEASANLANTARPEAIALIAARMLVDDPEVYGPMRGDVPPPGPRNLGTIHVLLEIMAYSPAFSPEVQKWAEDNQRASSKHILSMMRQWWKENETFIQQGRYEEVRPGEDLLGPERAAADALNAHEDAYRDELIAEGKDPADSANWDRWSKVIHPALESASSEPTRPVIAAPVATVLPATTTPVIVKSNRWVYIILGIIILALAGGLSYRMR